MSKHFIREQISEQALVHGEIASAVRAPHQVDRTFELPRALYVATVACYLGFIAILGTVFAAPDLMIPLAIFAVFIVAGFGVPALWTRLAPNTPSKAKTWGQFRLSGVNTLSGRLSAGEAAIQVLILPVLIVCWGIVVAIIAALV